MRSPGRKQTIGKALDKLHHVKVMGGIHFMNGSTPNDFTITEQADAIRNFAQTSNIMGNGKRTLSNTTYAIDN